MSNCLLNGIKQNSKHKCASVLFLLSGFAGIRGVEVVQQPNPGGGDGGVSLHPDAVHSAVDPAASATASLLFNQLFS